MRAILRLKSVMSRGRMGARLASEQVHSVARYRKAGRLLALTDAWLATMVGLLAGTIYWLGSAPGVLFGDGGELQFAAWTAGLPHPTGYPLYMILGWAWSHLLNGLGIATPARAMNLLSVILATFAVALTYLLARVLIEMSVPTAPASAQRLAGLTASITFALTPTFWSQAVVAEVYALQALFVALLLGLALRWQKMLDFERANGGSDVLTFRSRPAPALMILALVLGLSLTHHRTSLLLAPVLLVFVWRQDGYRLRRPRWLAILAVLASLPLLLYLYVPLRAPHSSYLSIELAPGQPIDLINRSLRGLAGYVLGRAFAGQLQGPAGALIAASSLPNRFLAELGVVGLGLALLGMLYLLSCRNRRLILLTGGAFLALTGFNLFYAIEDIRVFYIPSYLIATCWLGVAIAYVADELFRLFRRWPVTRNQAAALASLAALVPLIVLPAMLFLGYADRLDRSGHTRPQRWWDRLLAADLPAGAVLISNDRDEMMPLWYAQQVEGIRPDLTGLFPGLLPGESWANVGQVLENALASGRPVYLIKPMPGLEVKAHLGLNDSAGLVPVEGLAGSNVPQRKQDIVIGDVVRLTGYDVAPLHVQPGQTLVIDLYWQPLRKMAIDYTSFVHLLAADGKRIAQSDKLVGGSYYPTSAWKPGEMLQDRHRIQVPDDAPPGPYRLLAGMYQLVGQEARTIGSSELSGKVGGEAPAAAHDTTVANPFYANLNDEILLVGYDLAGERLASLSVGRPATAGATASSDLAVTLLWQATRPIGVDYTVFVHLLDSNGTIVAQRDVQPFANVYPTSVWVPGELLADVYIISLPRSLPAGTYDVVVGMYVARTQSRLPAYDDAGQRFPNDRVHLTQVKLN